MGSRKDYWSLSHYSTRVVHTYSRYALYEPLKVGLSSTSKNHPYTQPEVAQVHQVNQVHAKTIQNN